MRNSKSSSWNELHRAARHLPPGWLAFIVVLMGWHVGHGSPAAAAQQRPPNVLVILADDLGFSDVGCYGSEIATPHLDALAAHGLRFTQFYNTARCWPTRGALLTGYYAQQIGRDALPEIPRKNHRPGWAPLLPELLRPHGYRSYHSGKWHVDGGQLDGGFDRSYSLDDHNRFFSPRNHTLDEKQLPPVKRGSGYYATTAIADHAIECLQDHARDHADRPFFSYVAFNAPHFPLHAPADDVARYRDAYHVGWDATRQARWSRMQEMDLLAGNLSALEPAIGPPYHFPEALQKLGPGEVNRELAWDSLDDTQCAYQAIKMAIHAAMIDRMDQEIGRIIDQLRAMDTLNTTLIMFLSDNGASAEIMVRGDGHDPAALAGSADSYYCLGPGWSSAANTPFRRHKTWVHEGGISTPLIVHWPDRIAAGGEFRHAVGHVIDLAPTILELAGGDWPGERNGSPVPPSPGRSLVSTFNDDVDLPRQQLWWLHEGNRALRVGDWKLVAAQDEPWELYDLKHDRAETEDLAAEHPDRVRELSDTWIQTTAEFERLVGNGPSADGTAIPTPRSGAE